MPRARAGEDDLRKFWMIIEDKVFVRRIGIHANGSGEQFAIGVRQIFAQDAAHFGNFIRPYVLRERIRTRLFTLVMKGDLYAIAQIRKAIEETVRGILANEDRKLVGLE